MEYGSTASSGITCYQQRPPPLPERPPLPEGKDYHVFFSYRNTEEDRKWTRNVIMELESRGFKCCDHELDFLPGKEIIQNIKEYIKRSVKTVLVFSKEYNESLYCKIEVHYSLHMSLSEHKHILIPVKREDCEIPEDLEFFTWIDAREDIHLWFPQFLAAIKAPVDAGFTQPFLQFHKYENFDTIFEETSTSSCCGEAFQTRYIPDYLRRSGIDFNPEVLTEHVAKVSSTRLVRQRVFINPTRIICVIAYYFIIDFFLGGLAMMLVYAFVPVDFEYPLFIAGIPIALISGILGVAWPCYCYSSKRQGEVEMKLHLAGVNRVLVSSNIFMTHKIARMTAKVTIYFIYYDCRQCMEYIKEYHVRHHADETRVKIVDEDDTNEVNERTSLIGVNTRAIDIEEEALDKILDMSVSYFDKFLSGKLNHPRNIRHSRRAICLCQFLEEINKSCKEPNTQHHIIEV
ncbi:uncharacterized protein LOC127726700 isoform X1 [Mytilus californianus]|uniref:uncharacterized protein LOC127726700 isoform X1 n=1 Tax=Mytilus californianus TaxID=6549 RepID=UPI002247E22F|nr:uncharacterized protein LOC127726700 isoform X1 [Mytilus californianus]